MKINKIYNYIKKHVYLFYKKDRHFLLKFLLKNKNFTILSNNCIAGFIYNILNIQYLTPTVNCWFNPIDFCCFVLHLQGYTSCELQDVSNDEIIGLLQEGENLPPITIHFNH